jgi:hypothetical protein
MSKFTIAKIDNFQVWLGWFKERQRKTGLKKQITISNEIQTEEVRCNPTPLTKETVKYFPTSSNVYNINDHYIGKGIMIHGILQITRKERQ